MRHESWMEDALRLAADAAAQDEVPVGALVVREGLVLGQGHNQNIGLADPSAHAEILALREAGRYVNNYRLPDCEVYVTLEPCLMCFTAMIHARIARLIYGASDPKGGFSHFLSGEQLAALNHRIEIVPGVLRERCSGQIRDFFREKRQRGKRKWLEHS